MLLYPAIWVVPAVLNFFAYADGRAGGSYRAQADGVCAEANAFRAQAQSPEQIAAVLGEEERILRLLDPPPNWAERHAALVGEVTALSAEAQKVLRQAADAQDPQAALDRGWSRLGAREQEAVARIAANGFQDCSAAPAPA